MIKLTINAAFFSGQDIQWIAWLVIANIVLGVLISLIKGIFNFHHLSNFLHAMVLPYIFVFALFKVAATNWTYGDLMTQVALVFVLATLVAGLWEKLGHFGVPVPKWLSRAER